MAHFLVSDDFRLLRLPDPCCRNSSKDSKISGLAVGASALFLDGSPRKRVGRKEEPIISTDSEKVTRRDNGLRHRDLTSFELELEVAAPKRMCE